MHHHVALVEATRRQQLRSRLRYRSIPDRQQHDLHLVHPRRRTAPGKRQRRGNVFPPPPMKSHGMAGVAQGERESESGPPCPDDPDDGHRARLGLAWPASLNNSSGVFARVSISVAARTCGSRLICR